MTKKTRRHAFTVVELVIVIAVIAILAAVLIPTYANLVKKANEATALVDAKNAVTEMLANILDGGDDAADIIVLSKREQIYMYTVTVPRQEELLHTRATLYLQTADLTLLLQSLPRTAQ